MRLVFGFVLTLVGLAGLAWSNGRDATGLIMSVVFAAAGVFLILLTFKEGSP
jgi:hypothetical protein